jgi:histidine ammonia-lyase
VEFHAPLKPGVGPRAARELVRSISPRLGDDRSLGDDIEALAAAIRDGSALTAIEADVGELR